MHYPWFFIDLLMEIILSVNVKVLRGGISAYGWVKILLYCLWLNEHIHHILIGYRPTPPSFSLTTGREHSHKDTKLVEELPLGFLAAVTKALPLGLLAGEIVETLILSLRNLK